MVEGLGRALYMSWATLDRLRVLSEWTLLRVECPIEDWRLNLLVRWGGRWWVASYDRLQVYDDQMKLEKSILIGSIINAISCTENHVAVVTESGHLYAVTDEVLVLLSDAQPAWSLSYSPTLGLWAMGTNSHDILLSNGVRIKGHRHNVPSVAWNADQLLASASIDGTFAIWCHSQLLFQTNISEWAWSVLWIDTSQIEIDATLNVESCGDVRRVEVGVVGKEVLICAAESCITLISDLKVIYTLQLPKASGTQRLSLLCWCPYVSCLAVGDQPQGLVYLLHLTRINAQGCVCISRLPPLISEEWAPLAGMTLHRVDDYYTVLTVLNANGIIWQYRIHRTMII